MHLNSMNIQIWHVCPTFAPPTDKRKHLLNLTGQFELMSLNLTPQTPNGSVTWKLDAYHLQLDATDVLRSNLGLCFGFMTSVFICQAFFSG